MDATRTAGGGSGPAGMLVLYCPEPRQLARVRAVLGSGRPVVPTSDWQQLERQARRASCLIVAVEWLRGGELVQRVVQVRTRQPQVPLVLITSKDADAVRQLSRVRVEEIVWPHEVDAGLNAAVERALGETPVTSLAARLEALQLPPRLRRGMSAALVSSRPLRTVEQVAEVAGCDRRTLWRELRSVSEVVRLQDVLDWLLLVRLSALKTPGRKWRGVAEEAGLHEQTVSRMIARLTGLSRGAFTQLGAAAVVAMFERRVLGALLHGVDEDAAEGAADE